MRAKKLLGAALAFALMFSMPAPTSADTYASGASSQTFAGGPSGWSASTSTDGLCVPALLCPTVTNSWQAGGADGNGYIRTQFDALAETALGTATGVWQSPAFTYDGKNGHEPATATLNLNQRSDIGELLGATLLNDSSYRVDLVDQSNGRQISVVPVTALVPSINWTAIPSASVNPRLLQLGHNYKLQISTSYHAVASVVATGEVGYDNVRLTTAGRRGSPITTKMQLRQLATTQILPRSARMVGNRIKMRLRCPGKAAPKNCRIKVRGLATGKSARPSAVRELPDSSAGEVSRPMALKKFLRIRARSMRWMQVRVLPGHRMAYRNAQRIYVRSIIRVGRVRVVVRHRMALRHQSRIRQ